EVFVDGQNVAGPTAVSVSGTGVVARVVAADPAAGARVVGTSTARVRFEIAPDAPAGVREFRLLTPAGLTNRARFEVGKGTANVREEEPNDTPAAAQKGPVPVTVEGKVYPAEDVD